MAKGDKFYFENFIECAMLAKKASAHLVECLANYDAGKLPTMLAEMHEFEHNADKKKHEMNKALAKAFVTLRNAQKEFATYSQEQVDKIFLAAASAADKSIFVLISIRWDAIVINSLAISISSRFISSRYARYCSKIAVIDTS